METMTIKYNPANALVYAVIELIRNVKAIKIVKDSTELVPNAETIAAMKEAEEGKNLHHYDSVEDLMISILGKDYVSNNNNKQV